MNDCPVAPLIYLAGPSVFRPDAEAYALEVLNACRLRGLRGLYPFEAEEGHAAMTRSDTLFRSNLERIELADIVCADLNPFRGSEPDSGTCFELGYAHARGKRLYGFLSDTRPLKSKLGAKDRSGWHVEDFALPVNLMLGVPVRIVCGEVTDCLDEIARTLAPRYLNKAA